MSQKKYWRRSFRLRPQPVDKTHRQIKKPRPDGRGFFYGCVLRESELVQDLEAVVNGPGGLIFQRYQSRCCGNLSTADLVGQIATEHGKLPAVVHRKSNARIHGLIGFRLERLVIVGGLRFIEVGVGSTHGNRAEVQWDVIGETCRTLPFRYERYFRAVDDTVSGIEVFYFSIDIADISLQEQVFGYQPGQFDFSTIYFSLACV